MASTIPFLLPHSVTGIKHFETSRIEMRSPCPQMLCLICRSKSRPFKEVGPTLLTTE